MGKSSAPPPPDYMGLAQQQGQISSNLLQQQTTANRPSQITPWGNMTWKSTGAGPDQTWTGTETLNPQEMATLETQQATQGQSATAGQNLLNTSGFDKGLNFSGAPKVQGGNYYDPKAANAVWSEFQSMQEPLQQQQTQSQQAQLYGQGLKPGDAAYDTAMKNLSNTQYQQTQNAEDQAVLAGEQEAAQMQGMDVQAQNQYINAQEAQQMGNANMWNTLMGNNVGQLQTPQFAQAGVSATPDLMGAAENLYGAQVGNTNASNAQNANMWQGVGSLAATVAAAY